MISYGWPISSSSHRIRNDLESFRWWSFIIVITPCKLSWEGRCALYEGSRQGGASNRRSKILYITKRPVYWHGKLSAAMPFRFPPDPLRSLSSGFPSGHERRAV